MSARVRFLALLLLALRCTAAESPWIRVRTAHFELYTNDSEKKGREAILYFEQVRNFFLQASPSKKVPEFPVRLVAFRNEKQYTPYRPGEFADAFYSRGHSRDCIVMHSTSSERFPVVIHEYTHLIIQHTGLRLHPWANEGLAELFSTLKPMGKKALVGSLIPGRLITLQQNKWLDLATLDAVDHDSPYYNKRDKAGVFYAESWALMHMLRLSQDYMPQFEKILMSLHSGKGLIESIQAIYGKDARRAYQDLEAYLRRDRFSGLLFDVKLDKSEEEPEVLPVTGYESELVLADLLSRTDRKAEAKATYEKLVAANPGRPEAEEELGYLLWTTGDTAGAAQHLMKAVANGSTNPQACFHAGSLSHSAESRKALERAVALKPDYSEARINLGLALLNERKYREALLQLREVKKIDEDQATTVFSALAHCFLFLGNEEEARKHAELARKWAKTPLETSRAASILQHLDERKERQRLAAERQATLRTQPVGAPKNADDDDAPAPQQPATGPAPQAPDTKRVEGTATKLDCAGTKAKLHVRVGTQLMAFLIADPSGVTIRHAGKGTFDFTCGPQKPFSVVVEYLPRADAKIGTAGDIRVLEF